MSTADTVLPKVGEWVEIHYFTHADLFNGIGMGRWVEYWVLTKVLATREAPGEYPMANFNVYTQAGYFDLQAEGYYWRRTRLSVDEIAALPLAIPLQRWPPSEEDR
jgi:hypothetical protein